MDNFIFNDDGIPQDEIKQSIEIIKELTNVKRRLLKLGQFDDDVWDPTTIDDAEGFSDGNIDDYLRWFATN